MEQVVHILPDDFICTIAAHLHESFIAERRLPFRVQTADALHDGVKDHLQFSLQLAGASLQGLVQGHGCVRTYLHRQEQVSS